MENLNILHWNCNHVLSKIEILKHYLIHNQPDIVLLNETKLDTCHSNFYLDFDNYNVISKPRNKYGGGVAILINKKLDFIHDFSFEHYELELIHIKIMLSNNLISIFSLYNPPNKVLSITLFKEIQEVCENFIIIGDLNAKTKELGCHETNESGKVLEEILASLNMLIIDEKTPTFHLKNKF